MENSSIPGQDLYLAMSNPMPGNGGAWEQSNVAFVQHTGTPVQVSRLQIGDSLGQESQDGSGSPVDDDGDGYSGSRLDLQQQQQKKKEFKRTWREEWKTRHKWVHPIKAADGEVKLKCHWCTLFNMDNVFAREGCSTIQMSALNTHAKSEAHKAAESRLNSSELTNFALPDNSFDIGKSTGEAAIRDGFGHTDLGQVTAGKKRKMLPISSKGDTLASIMQRNSSKIVQLLLDAENGRNARHATNVTLMKKHLKTEENRLRLEQDEFEHEKARFENRMELGQRFIAALTDIGEGLKKIGEAIELRRTSM